MKKATPAAPAVARPRGTLLNAPAPEAGLIPSQADSTAVIGYASTRGRPSWLAFEDPLFVELRGTQAIKTFDRMLSDGIIAGVVDRMGLLMRAPRWTIEAGGKQAIDIKFADFVREQFDELEIGFQDVVSNMRDAVAYGFDLQEMLFERQGNETRLVAFSPRDARTIDRWDTDTQTGHVRWVHQSTEDGYQQWMPGWKLFHFRLRPASGRPQGQSLLRNAFLAWQDKQELRRIIKVGVRRDLTGLTKMEVPLKLMLPSATAEDKAALAEYVRMVRETERDQREGLVVPSETNPQTGEASGYKLSLLTSGGRRQMNIEDLVGSHNKEIAIALLAEVVLVGMDQVGSFAMESSKANWLARAINAWVSGVAEQARRKTGRTIRALNPQFAAAALPIWKHSDIAEIPIDELFGGVSQAVGSGAMVPDPGLDAMLRRRVGAPALQGEEEL